MVFRLVAVVGLVLAVSRSAAALSAVAFGVRARVRFRPRVWLGGLLRSVGLPRSARRGRLRLAVLVVLAPAVAPVPFALPAPPFPSAPSCFFPRPTASFHLPHAPVPPPLTFPTIAALPRSHQHHAHPSPPCHPHDPRTRHSKQQAHAPFTPRPTRPFLTTSFTTRCADPAIKSRQPADSPAPGQHRLPGPALRNWPLPPPCAAQPRPHAFQHSTPTS